MKIGFIGMGLMGEPMSANLAKAGYEVLVANRTFEKAKRQAEALSEYGVRAVESNRELASLSDVIITMVPRTEDVERIEAEIRDELGPGKTWIDMSTIAPQGSRGIAERVKALGAQFIDAPVVRSRAAAIAGKLGIYVGCDEEELEKVLPILRCMGENVIRMGGNGSGLVMKLCHNALVSQIQNGVNETIALAKAHGIDVGTYARAISYGGGQNAYLDGHVTSLAMEDYTAAFSLQNAAKDVGLALELAAQAEVPMPGEALVKEIYDEALAMGLGPLDWDATIKVVEKRGRGL